MNPEVNLTKLSVNDDIALDRTVSAYLEFILGCSSVGDCPKKELASYVAGMGAYYCSDVFSIDVPGKESSSGLVAACFDGDKITVEDLFIREKMRKRGIGRMAIEALGGEFPIARVMELESLRSAEEFYQQIGFECVAPATNGRLSLWQKKLN